MQWNVCVGLPKCTFIGQIFFFLHLTLFGFIHRLRHHATSLPSSSIQFVYNHVMLALFDATIETNNYIESVLWTISIKILTTNARNRYVWIANAGAIIGTLGKQEFCASKRMDTALVFFTATTLNLHWTWIHTKQQYFHLQKAVIYLHTQFIWAHVDGLLND